MQELYQFEGGMVNIRQMFERLCHRGIRPAPEIKTPPIPEEPLLEPTESPGRRISSADPVVIVYQSEAGIKPMLV